MVDINTTLTALEPALPVINNIQSVVAKIEILIGGVFGLYALLFLIKLILDYKDKKTLKEIKKELKMINEKLAIMEQKGSDKI